MTTFQTELQIQTTGQGLVKVTSLVEDALKDAPSGAGLLHIFIQHTSASLLIQENADPTARQDLEEFIQRLVPENQSWHRHLDEGPDDTVSHMKAAVLPQALTVPVRDGRLLLGTWQGLYVWEHRRAPHVRKLVLTLLL